MTYEQVKSLKPEDFKRLCGVRLETFKQMLEIVRSQKEKNKKHDDLGNSAWKTNC
ncbi:hypothetical protein [Anabaena azotica]|uniref:Uncharacterized protein n=1 Tax=Anabaena azotica FACHB-119 TaxID=947527 RepID=A0ABR8D3U6_9NOST|nr:hypothetical protein [Anabaena azotica]MBD2501131.1 hypothetical protein [Anabaena azotica FACHB-119]